ncbi:hypothetical protein SAMN06269173_110111 [Hymenobacter mucosus]|jgi:hypothetical protein|uniref:Uncharacterized protein n=2 Tax=Hymenobacter mucosus TaxID=1411120 RepID=A0A239A1A1_9BACT|nr:hypothetical protein SAMN06269173_110111 [Hymenobacter mucosus]
MVAAAHLLLLALFRLLAWVLLNASMVAAFVLLCKAVAAVCALITALIGLVIASDRLRRRFRLW